MEIRVGGVRRNRAVRIWAWRGGTVPDSPELVSRPKSRHGLLQSLRVREDDAEFQIVERVSVGLTRGISPLADTSRDPVPCALRLVRTAWSGLGGRGDSWFPSFS